MTLTIDGYNFETSLKPLTSSKAVRSQIADVKRHPYSDEIYLAAVKADEDLMLSNGRTATVVGYTYHSDDNTVSFQLYLN